MEKTHKSDNRRKNKGLKKIETEKTISKQAEIHSSEKAIDLVRNSMDAHTGEVRAFIPTEWPPDKINEPQTGHQLSGNCPAPLLNQMYCLPDKYMMKLCTALFVTRLALIKVIYYLHCISFCSCSNILYLYMLYL